MTVFLSTLPFTSSFPGNAFCHDELLMSASVEASIVSENKRVTPVLLFSSPRVNLNQQSNEPPHFPAELRVVIKITAASQLYPPTSC